jgi:hypothetical protein
MVCPKLSKGRCESTKGYCDQKYEIKTAKYKECPKYRARKKK